MRKFWVLAFKEVLLTFRDRGASVMMLVTPLALTLVMWAAFGSGGESPISDIPVLLLNRDEGTLSQSLVDVFTSDALSDLVDVTLVTDEAAARAEVEADAVAALVIIPPDFSARVLPMSVLAEELAGVDITQLTPETTLTAEQQMQLGGAVMQSQSLKAAEPAAIEIYASPDWRISALAVKAIVGQGTEMLAMQVAGTSKTLSRMIEVSMQGGAMPSEAFAAISPAGSTSRANYSELPIVLKVTSTTGRAFNWLGYYASSMAITFLMFAVTVGGRSLLAERENGTLSRLLTTPNTPIAMLVGKMGGTILVGVLQMIILWGATALLGVYWGHPLGVFLAIVALVFSASGVGAMISSWAKTHGQASAIGIAFSLVGAGLSGSFVVRNNMPTWIQQISLISPNAWGIEIFSRLQAGKGLVTILPWLGGTLVLAVIFYGAALIGFRRQFD
ncbi:MAG: ABC transporter permease [Anaerolineae bacterium]|nr:ABC transporter permease [Anaerolineae bacterium]